MILRAKTSRSITLAATSLLSIMITSSMLTGCGDKSPALATVGNTAITMADLDKIARVNPRLKPRLETEAGREKVLENFIDQEILYQEANRRGLDRQQVVKDKLELYQKVIISQALLDEELDKKVKEYYEGHKDEFERIKIAHILVRYGEAVKNDKETPAKPDVKKDPKTAKADAAKDPKNKDAKAKEAPKKEEKKSAGRSEADALALANQLKAKIQTPEDFEKIAKESSDDDKTKLSKGELGYVTVRDKRLERWGWLPLAEKAFALKVGEVSEPIKTKDGYHIIKVLEEKQVQPFEEAQASIKFRIQGSVKEEILSDLKKKYNVVLTKAPKGVKAETKALPPEATPEVIAEPKTEGTPPPVDAAAPSAAPAPTPETAPAHSHSH